MTVSPPDQAGRHRILWVHTRQVPLAETALAAAGLTARVARSADLEATVVIGRRPVLDAAC